MRVWARRNRVGFVHLWLRREDFEEGRASEHFFNGRTDPRWAEIRLPPGLKEALEAGELVEIEDPGYFGEEEG
ncbi:MAG: hypothetical protein HY823_15405 [Acidobacteria bacterium]|nr:hypothetical protein [Acidobacteriota bacterium]